MDNDLIIRMARKHAHAAGYPGLKTAPTFHQWAEAAGVLQKVEQDYGPVKHCWATLGEPGTPGIPEHDHNHPTVVYYPHDHPVGTWVEGRFNPAVEGEFVHFDTGALHHVEPNDTDEDRITLIFTLERT